MKLNEIFPSNVSFKLGHLTEELELRPVTIEDTVFMTEKFGEDLTKITIADFCVIVARLLTPESKKYLAQVVVKQYDDYGNEEELKLTLSEKIMKLATDYELKIIIDALMEIRKRSNIMLENMNNKAGESGEKKRLTGKR